MGDRNIKRYSLSRQVSDELENMIESGEYRIGDKIPTEIELMELFNVSRNTIREAIQSLTSAGILVVKQGDGTYVKSSNRFNGCMNLKYEQVSIADIKEARKALEVSIAYLAAQRRTEEDMERITVAFELRNNQKSTVKENTDADINFHMAIAESCHNKILFDLYQSIFSFVENHISARQIEMDYNQETVEELHQELYKSIKIQDAPNARSCAANILNV